MPPRHSAGFEYRLFRTQGSAANAAVPWAIIYRLAIRRGSKIRFASLTSNTPIN